MTDFHTVVDGRLLTECPRWHDGRLWFADAFDHAIFAVDADGTVERVVDVPGQPNGIGWLPDGRMLVVSMLDRRILRVEADGSVTEHADLSGLSEWEINDMVVDAHGRAYVGPFGFDFTNRAPIEPVGIIRVDPDGSVHADHHPLAFPNGMAITPDGTTLIVSESLANRLTAFTVAADGSLTDRRIWASFGPPPTTTDLVEALGALDVAADGICLDAEGAVWVADAMHQRVVRVTEGGRIADEKSSPQAVFACTLGGDHGTELFICSSDWPGEDGHRERTATIRATTVDVAHAGLP